MIMKQPRSRATPARANRPGERDALAHLRSRIDGSMETGYTAEQAATILLSGTGLSDWQVGFLAVALNEVAEWRERIGKVGGIACYECASELTQMNSMHRGSVEPVVYALSGLSFSVSWQGDYGARSFFVEQHERRDLLPQTDFDALYVDCGWGSDAHRQALRARFDTRETA